MNKKTKICCTNYSQQFLVSLNLEVPEKKFYRLYGTHQKISFDDFVLDQV